MKYWIFSSIIMLGALAVWLPKSSAAPEFSVLPEKVRAVINEKTIEVILPVTVQHEGSVSYDLHVSIEDLRGKSLGASAMQLEISQATPEISLIVNAQVDQQQLAAYVLHYTIKKGEQQFEGKKSLFYAVSQLDTHLLMQRRFYANSQAAVRVVVTDPASQEPVHDAEVSIALDSNEVFQGATNERGTLDASFILPADVIGDHQLSVQVRKGEARDQVQQQIQIQDVYKILLTTDKPLYQPGQVIHIRSLALRKPDLLPAGDEEMTLEVEDSKGNKVFKRSQRTNEFGISAAEFQLAHELNEGPYKIRAIFGDNTQEKTVTVERYVLPKFNLVLDTDNRYYQPGQTLKGDLQVDYFFGKPVSGGTVVVTLSKFDVEFEKFAELKGKTDENGHYEFETKLPEYFVGQPLEQGNAFVKIDVSVVDTADHEEKKTLTRTIAADALNIVVIPESGTITPGLENIFYFAVSYPDGTPAEAVLTINVDGGSAVTLQTDASGIAEMPVTPQEQTCVFAVIAKDAAGHAVSKNFQFDADGRSEQILVRTNKALYKIGETIAIDIFSAKTQGSVYVDLIKDGQTFLTTSVELDDGRAILDLEAAVAGSIQLHTYQILASSDMIRDTKLLYVEAADELQIGVTTAKPTFLPGEDAQIDFQVTNRQGHPVLAALGVNIVDESVFALQEMQPGLEKIYFMLEKEIMTPRYEIHAYSMEGVIMDTPFIKEDQAQHEQIRQKAAQVLLASAENLVNYDVNINTFARKTQNIQSVVWEPVMEDFRKIYQAMYDYSVKHERVLTAKEGIEKLVEAGFLTAEDLLDPWGNPYRVEPGNDDFTYHRFHCLGPDELENTADDLWFDAYLDIQHKDRSFFDWLFGGRDKDGDFMMNAPRMMVRQAMPLAAPPMVLEKAEMAMDMAASVETKAGGAANGDSGPRIREYFPETLYTNPAILTDDQGKASIQLIMADSITTWRLTSMASSLNGTLGSGTSAIKVFQDFFVDIDLPVTLTQNDQVSIPIAIYNYLPGSQSVRLKLSEEPWFELINDIAEKTISLNSGQVDVVYFTIKVKDIGWHKLTVHAYGSEMSDAIARTIEVLPDGERIELTWNGRLSADVEQVVTIPKEAIEHASKIIVKVYPGIFSQIVEGLDSILRMPSGCFEQTSSATYPNILVLDYMKQVGQITPEIQMKAESYINTGYQRLLSYEVQGGGFEWFGRPPAHKILTAYGLMEFYDMAQVHEVDPNVIVRTQQWLAAQQEKDGSWKPTQEYLDEVAGKFTNDVMRNTAYITWALLASQYRGEAVAKAITYIQDNIDEIKDTYTLALAANAMVLNNPDDAATVKLLETLLNKKKEEQSKIWWEADSSTSTNASGLSANIETTALTALAFMQAEKYHETVSKILTFLIESKDSYGTWHSTQATILAMKALLLSMKNATSQTDAEVAVLLNGKIVEEFALTPENSDVMRLFDLKEATEKGENRVQLRFGGEGSALYQIVGRFYLPWKEKPETAELMSIAVSYDKTELVKDDVLTANVVVKNNRPERANMIIVDLGLPPGFEVMAGDLAELVGDETITKFNLTGRQIIVYLDHVDQKQPVEFSYRLKAKFPVKAKTPVSTVYEYYNPDVKNEALPQEITVSEAAPAL
ncbi:alpha-2-macroglobulin [Candidatus Vecturithrix granuli]|uniref:Alpha-2-macroglobulin n=1 Tax=Vecturithrix granuli TaxID=1499967 RepID=A0A081C6J2_VECG1|nr:alpha-2-macroglobulin [Candidatus Vecturithrix granuli]